MLFMMMASSYAQESPGAPTVQDCLGAIPVCQPVYSTFFSYTGHGNVYPEIHNNSVCPLCMDGEKNDVFYIITVQTDGILRFTLTPNNPDNDYDWSVFNMTNADCSEIYTNALELQVSCNSYGNFGYNGPTGINTALGNNSNCNGPGVGYGPAFNKDLTVFAGQTYVINISNWSTTQQSGYVLDFSASTASMFDTVPPLIDSVQELIPCSGATELFFRFSENVRCEDVFQHPEKFLFSGAAGPVSILNIGSEGCETGAPQSPGYFMQFAAPVVSGSYTLSIVGDIRDLCDNLALCLTYCVQISGINAPVAHAGNDTTVANGAVITLHGSATGGTSPLFFHWEPVSLLVDPNIPNPVTVNLGASTLFTLSVTDNLGCISTDEVQINVVGGALSVIANASNSSVCLGGFSVLTALPSGGSGNYTYSWSSDPPGFVSSLPNPTVYPTGSTTYLISVADGFSVTSSSVSITVHPLPVADAGQDCSIPCGTTAQLYGNAYGGSGIYSFWWVSNPPGFTSPLQNPVSPNLSQSAIFMLEVTDQSTGCIGDPDEVIVTVTGSPLSVFPLAMQPVICSGSETRLMAMAGGGSGNYTYSWSSDPPGFTSSDVNPVIEPEQTTSYYLTVNDGYNLATGSLLVTVNPLPLIYLGPADTLVCAYDTIVLDAGNPGSEYYWSNGSTASTISVGSTGIGYDYQSYRVQVVNLFGCMDSASISVTFSMVACLGSENTEVSENWTILPNPNRGKFLISADPICESFDCAIYDLFGRKIFFRKIFRQEKEHFLHLIDLNHVTPGLYLMECSCHHQVVCKKILIQ